MDKAAQVLAQVAEQLGYQGARLWPQAVQITWLKSLVSLGFTVFLLVGFGLAFWYSMRWRKHWVAVRASLDDNHKYDYNGPSRDDLFWVPFTVGLAWLIVFGLIMSTVPQALTGLVYPEAQTALDLIGAINKK